MNMKHEMMAATVMGDHSPRLKSDFLLIVTVLSYVFLGGNILRGEDVKVTGIKAFCRDGQTFITWKDAAEGKDGSGFRYNLYACKEAITEDNLGKAELVISGIPNNSGKHYGYALTLVKRIEPDTPMAAIEPDGKPLDHWTGLAVRTVKEDGTTFYAVCATDTDGKVLSKIIPGESALTESVNEKKAPIQPVKIGDSATRGAYANVLKITGEKNLPLEIQLHASSGQGGPGDVHGDYYLYWGLPEWGYREGLQWQFAVKEQAKKLICTSRETIAHSNGVSSLETYWFGYYCVPQWAEHKEPRAYNFTERRMLWVIDWVIKKYNVDPERVYCTGGSMGAWGTTAFALRHPEIFAAIYPNRPRTMQKRLPSLVKVNSNDKIMMDDGKTIYYDRMNMVEFARNHHDDLPFMGWCCGRHDGFATFREEIEMVKAMTEAHHGFVFSWNDGNHSSGVEAMKQVEKYYPASKFARNQSYPAFGNSSINDDIGTGEVEEKVNGRSIMVMKDDNGVTVGGINLGFDWKDVLDEENKWSAKISNDLCKDTMTVDVTPRHCQKFKPVPGSKLNWSSSTGDKGEVITDKWGLVTIEKLKIKPSEVAELTISKPD